MFWHNLKSVFLSKIANGSAPSRQIRHIICVWPTILASIHLGFKLQTVTAACLGCLHIAAILYIVWKPKFTYSPNVEILLKSVNSGPKIESWIKRTSFLSTLIIIFFTGAYLWRTNCSAQIFKEYGLLVEERLLFVMLGSAAGFGMLAHALMEARNKASALSEILVGGGIFVYTFGSYCALPQLLDAFIYYMYIPLIGVLVDITLHPIEHISDEEAVKAVMSYDSMSRRLLLTCCCSFLFSWCTLMGVFGYFEYLNPLFWRLEIIETDNPYSLWWIQYLKGPFDSIIVAGSKATLGAFIISIIIGALWVLLFVGLPNIAAKINKWRKPKNKDIEKDIDGSHAKDGLT